MVLDGRDGTDCGVGVADREVSVGDVDERCPVVALELAEEPRGDRQLVLMGTPSVHDLTGGQDVGDDVSGLQRRQPVEEVRNGTERITAILEDVGDGGV